MLFLVVTIASEELGGGGGGDVLLDILASEFLYGSHYCRRRRNAPDYRRMIGRFTSYLVG